MIILTSVGRLGDSAIWLFGYLTFFFSNQSYVQNVPNPSKIWLNTSFLWTSFTVYF